MGGGLHWGEADDNESIDTIHAALDAGINFIDTAPVYGFGRCEQVVGRAIQERRDGVVLATKCGLWWEDARGAVFAEYDSKLLRCSLRPETIRIEITPGDIQRMERQLKHRENRDDALLSLAAF